MSIHDSQSPSRISIGMFVMLIIVLIAAIVGAVYAAMMIQTIRQKQAEVDAVLLPARISVVKITTPACMECFSVDGAVDALKKERVTVIEEHAVTFDSDEGKALIVKHGIRNVPTYVVTGELTKDKFGPFMDQHGENHGDVFVLTKTPFAYIDLTDQKEHGGVNATLIIDPIRCKDCTDPLFLIDRLKQGAGVALRDEKVLHAATAEARVLIAKYKIKKIPAMILTDDVAAYSLLQNTAIGSIEKDGAFILRDVPLPYFDLIRGRIVKGDVTLVMLTDGACADCYDVTNHEKILATFGVQVAAKKTVDITSPEGKILIRQYGITKVPTILLSPEASAYDQLMNIWKQVGIIAPNGWYVFNKFQELGPVIYNDLALKKIIRPAPAVPEAQK